MSSASSPVAPAATSVDVSPVSSQVGVPSTPRRSARRKPVLAASSAAPIAVDIAKKVSKRKPSSNSWISHVKEHAVKHNLKFSAALKDSTVRDLYKRRGQSLQEPLLAA